MLGTETQLLQFTAPPPVTESRIKRMCQISLTSVAFMPGMKTRSLIFY